MEWQKSQDTPQNVAKIKPQGGLALCDFQNKDKCHGMTESVKV